MFDGIFSHFEWIIALLLAAVLVLVVVVMFLAARFEKQVVGAFVEIPADERPELSAYAQAVNQAAASLGFHPCDTRRHGEKPGCFGSLWLSPARDILVLVGSGKVARLALKKTLLYSRVAESRYLVTCDDFGEGEISGLIEKRVLLNADFLELLAHHRQRLQESEATPIPFEEAIPWEELERLEGLRVRDLEERGYARFTNPAEAVWRYTWKGAVKLASHSFLRQIREATSQRHRGKIKRPGHTQYVESTARTSQSRSETSPMQAADGDSSFVFDAQEIPPQAWRHSGAGIASFVVALTFGTLELALVVFAVVTTMDLEEHPTLAGVLGLVILTGILGMAAGFVLGIVGVLQKYRKKAFAIAGLILNAGILLLFGALLFIGAFLA